MDEVGLGPAPRPPVKEPGSAWTVAQFVSRCPACKVEIREGDPVGLIDGVGWCCSGCAS